LRGQVGCETFGSNRWINQRFYTSREWRRLRDEVIIRDNSCDLGVDGYDIHVKLIVHHMNPLTEEDIMQGTRFALDPEYLICTTHDTHNAIHYGDASLLNKPYTPRTPGDTKLW
jgi:5-methylcytosine-specific restriction endonuclease McrA